MIHEKDKLKIAALFSEAKYNWHFGQRLMLPLKLSNLSKINIDYQANVKIRNTFTFNKSSIINF